MITRVRFFTLACREKCLRKPTDPHFPFVPWQALYLVDPGPGPGKGCAEIQILKFQVVYFNIKGGGKLFKKGTEILECHEIEIS